MKRFLLAMIFIMQGFIFYGRSVESVKESNQVSPKNVEQKNAQPRNIVEIEYNQPNQQKIASSQSQSEKTFVESNNSKANEADFGLSLDQIDFSSEINQSPSVNQLELMPVSKSDIASEQSGIIFQESNADSINQSILANQKYSELVSVGVDKYKNGTVDEIRASIGTAALGNARTVLVGYNASPEKQADIADAINDLSAKIDAAGPLITSAGIKSYQSLKNSFEVYSDIAKDPNNQTLSENRDKAVAQLDQQRKSLGDGYQGALKLLKSTATKEQVAQAKDAIQQKIGDKNSDKIFKSGPIREDYDTFLKNLTALKDGISDPSQLASFLEKELQLKPGDLNASPISPSVSAKLERLYQTIDLIATKKGTNVSGSSQAMTFVNKVRGSRLSNSSQIQSLMNGIKNIDPTVKTSFENQLLQNSTNKEAVLLVSQSDFLYITMGRAMKELNAISILPTALRAMAY